MITLAWLKYWDFVDGQMTYVSLLSKAVCDRHKGGSILGKM